MLDPQTLEEINLHKFLSKNVIRTSSKTKKMCIDVGLAGGAAHSALWLYVDPNRCSIGIEPLQVHWDSLNGFFDTDQKENDKDVEWEPT